MNDILKGKSHALNAFHKDLSCYKGHTKKLFKKDITPSRPSQGVLKDLYGCKGLYNLLKKVSKTLWYSYRGVLPTPRAHSGASNTHTQSALWGVTYAHPDHRGVREYIRTPRAHSGASIRTPGSPGRHKKNTKTIIYNSTIYSNTIKY
jgi:hypothetical protein